MPNFCASSFHEFCKLQTLLVPAFLGAILYLLAISCQPSTRMLDTRRNIQAVNSSIRTALTVANNPDILVYL